MTPILQLILFLTPFLLVVGWVALDAVEALRRLASAQERIAKVIERLERPNL